MTRPDAAEISKSLRWFAGLTAAVCWCGLALQLYLVIVEAGKMGGTWPFAVVVFALFLTMQVNLLAAIVTTFAAIGVQYWPARGRVRSAIAVYLAIGGFVFLVMLRPAFQHAGVQALADALLHYVTPSLYGLFWLVAVPKDDLRWRDAAIWMVYPTIYLGAVLAFDLWSGFTHYPLFDPRSLDMTTLVMNIAATSCMFLLGGLLAVALGRFIASR